MDEVNEDGMKGAFIQSLVRNNKKIREELWYCL